MIAPLPNWDEPIAEGEIELPDGKKIKFVVRTPKPFRAWLESVQSTLEDHETRIETLEP